MRLGRGGKPGRAPLGDILGDLSLGREGNRLAVRRRRARGARDRLTRWIAALAERWGGRRLAQRQAWRGEKDRNQKCNPHVGPPAAQRAGGSAVPKMAETEL